MNLSCELNCKRFEYLATKLTLLGPTVSKKIWLPELTLLTCSFAIEVQQTIDKSSDFTQVQEHIKLVKSIACTKLAKHELYNKLGSRSASKNSVDGRERHVQKSDDEPNVSNGNSDPYKFGFTDADSWIIIIPSVWSRMQQILEPEECFQSQQSTFCEHNGCNSIQNKEMDSECMKQVEYACWKESKQVQLSLLNYYWNHEASYYLSIQLPKRSWMGTNDVA